MDPIAPLYVDPSYAPTPIEREFVERLGKPTRNLFESFSFMTNHQYWKQVGVCFGLSLAAAFIASVIGVYAHTYMNRWLTQHAIVRSVPQVAYTVLVLFLFSVLAVYVLQTMNARPVGV